MLRNGMLVRISLVVAAAGGSCNDRGLRPARQGSL